jgi:hypothetical protein
MSVGARGDPPSQYAGSEGLMYGDLCQGGERGCSADCRGPHQRGPAMPQAVTIGNLPKAFELVKGNAGTRSGAGLRRLSSCAR